MAKLNVPPTKSSLLLLGRQLKFALEGFDLLDQKRQILVYELISRLDRATETEARLEVAMQSAYAALREALLDSGSDGIDRAALGVRGDQEVEVTFQSLMGLRLPQAVVRGVELGVQFGLSGTSAHLDRALRCFSAVLPLLAEMAVLENTVIRLARELRKTQRRCNALSKVFIPAHRETIGFIAGALEERERESFVILKMLRDRLADSRRR